MACREGSCACEEGCPERAAAAGGVRGVLLGRFSLVVIPPDTRPPEGQKEPLPPAPDLEPARPPDIVADDPAPPEEPPRAPPPTPPPPPVPEEPPPKKGGGGGAPAPKNCPCVCVCECLPTTETATVSSEVAQLPGTGAFSDAASSGGLTTESGRKPKGTASEEEAPQDALGQATSWVTPTGFEEWSEKPSGDGAMTVEDSPLDARFQKFKFTPAAFKPKGPKNFLPQPSAPSPLAAFVPPGPPTAFTPWWYVAPPGGGGGGGGVGGGVAGAGGGGGGGGGGGAGAAAGAQMPGSPPEPAWDLPTASGLE